MEKQLTPGDAREILNRAQHHIANQPRIGTLDFLAAFDILAHARYVILAEELTKKRFLVHHFRGTS